MKKAKPVKVSQSADIESANWTVKRILQLVECCLEELNNSGVSTFTGFKLSGWTTIKKCFNFIAKCNFSTRQLQCQVFRLQNKYDIDFAGK